MKTKIEMKISTSSVIRANFETAGSPDSQIWTVNTQAISICIKVQQHILKNYDDCILTLQEENRMERCVGLTPEPGVCLNETVTAASKQPGRETRRNSMSAVHFISLCWSQVSDVIHFRISVISVVEVDAVWLTTPFSTLKLLTLYWANMHLKWMFLRSWFLWDVTQRQLVVCYRPFETTYPSHLQWNTLDD
jgi:hypothetical protein